jgi:hypothetical protein
MGTTIRLDYPRTYEISIPSSVAPEDESFYIAVAKWEFETWLNSPVRNDLKTPPKGLKILCGGLFQRLRSPS